MKKIILAFSLILFFSSFNNVSTIHKNLQVKVAIGKKIYYQSHFVKKCELYPIQISLINNTDSILQFWVMSCSWERSFIFNTNAIRFFNLGCDKDVADHKILAARKSLTYNGYLQISNHSNLKRTNDLKLGFIIIREYDPFKEINLFKILQAKNNSKKGINWCETPIKYNWR
jgi:hypothetical protein